ncbi:quinone-dependent dihydroorotate dehydrogenase [Candidatus Liberibacter americanus]|uniref:quinone-dependent dihydroorotate dehydrogenase n=1 Tax=Candidatus Liberibacter americanus TaxID=309868 RepID=UPI0002C5FBC1|nr:quinone-dependent dihydroorotate dehydrogenase [Candidatus Liberibacter americanus]EMS36719.1 dihydroorotate dehydrogenase 2 [Candidatus Liberibacter americanus PW_SP]
MLNIVKNITWRSLLLLDPEAAHRLSILALKSGLLSSLSVKNDPNLSVKVAGISFPNPLGMAAGYDKNAEVPLELLKIGFGFVEIGTVTPNPQSGNPRPRIFRLMNEKAIINQLGFNNKGHNEIFTSLCKIKKTAPIGVNIGANKDSKNFILDYVSGIHKFFKIASYFSINISSPNTPGLRNLQKRLNLKNLLTNIMQARKEESKKTSKLVPVFLKISPDLSEEELDIIANEALSQQIEGIIIANTTLSRENLKNPMNYTKNGGLSGLPLFTKSTIILAKMRKRVGQNMAIIGTGGISSTEDAIEKIMAGANLIQLYTAMIYEGILLPKRIIKGLSNFLNKEKTNLEDIRGTRIEYWANKAI